MFRMLENAGQQTSAPIPGSSFSVFRPGRRALVAIVALAGMGFSPTPAAASTYWETVVKNAAVVIDTALGNLTAEQEVDKINANWEEWRRQRELSAQISVGQAGVDNVYPVSRYSPCEPGRPEVLTYFFIDPATGLRTPIHPGFEVAAVRYEALLQPFTMDPAEVTEASIRAHLVVLGVSADPASDFAIPFPLQGFEPMIFAFPIDWAGSEIPGEGTAGFASHVLAPRADYNHDGFVDGIDYDMFNNDFESPDPVQQMHADYNGDGFVDGIDYDLFNNDFEYGC